MFSDDSPEAPRHYSQAAAAAMHDGISAARARIRQLENLVGILNREAENQAAVIADLREGVAHWKSRYVQACAAADTEEK